MALTKTLVFEQDVIDVLKRMTWSEDGTKGTINGQLERKLYEAVNKALAAMGGKWSRQAGGHVFETDPRPQVEGLLENGNLVVARDGFFETPEAVVRRMLELADIQNRDWVLEPSAGLGAIARQIIPFAPRCLYLVEKNLARYEKLRDTFVTNGLNVKTFCRDFLESLVLVTFDKIVMNPPFEEGQDIDHVQHAYKMLNETGTLVSVMSEGPFFRGDKKATAFREWFESVGGESEPLPDGAFKESGTGVKARLIIIRHG